jgi:ABC-type sugar transport system ATPase subunit
MIELQDIGIASGSFRLSSISLRIAAGEHATLMGRTGQGKTTILEAIAGLRAITSGRILIDGSDVTSLPPAERGIGFVPQDLALFPTMSVRENVAFALRVRGWQAARCEARVHELADWLGLAKLLDRSVRTLSGGEAQRTALGRALAAQPKVLLLDEPFSALDDATRAEMHDLMRSVRAHSGVTVLHITHHRAESMALGTQRLELIDKKIIDPGAPRD